MSGEARSRLDRYLRVAYDGEGSFGRTSPAARTPGRWAVGTAVATRLAAVVLVLAVAGATFLLVSQRAEAPAAPVADPVGAASMSSTTAAAEETASEEVSAVVVVHVAGAVEHPGVVELNAGTRVDAAIAAAGGATEIADLDALNLAAPVVDGQQVYVPEVGETVAPVTSSGGGGGTAPEAGGLVDVNTADVTALDTLPGIGPALAQRIVDWRTEHGPFASVEALTDVSGIGPATMDRLRDLVTV